MSKDIVPASGKDRCEPLSCCRTKTGKSANVRKETKVTIQERTGVSENPAHYYDNSINPFFPPRIGLHDRITF